MTSTGTAADQVEITLDTSEVPDLKEWGEHARSEMIAWYPRMVNLIPSLEFQPPTKIAMTIRKSNEGIAFTSRDRVVVSSHWIEKHPDDVGLVIHEMVHVIQSYPNGGPGWITEGIADYLRWAIYEGKPLSFFPVGEPQRGYRGSYRVTAGFLLWLESGPAPGIVTKLNTAMRKGQYTEAVFEQASGKTLDELWSDYVTSRRKP